MEDTEKIATLSERFDKYLFTKYPENDEAFKCLNSLIDYLQIKRVSEYAKENNKSPQAVYQYGKTTKVLGLKVVFDNE